MYTQRYYPVVKWKQGEQVALKNLTAIQQESFIPIVEIVDTVSPSDFLRSLDGLSCPVCIDTVNIESGEKDCMTAIIRQAMDDGTSIYPVLSQFDVLQAGIDPILKQNAFVRIPIIADIDGPQHDEIIGKIRGHSIENYSVILDVGPTTQQEYISLQYTALKAFLSKYREFLLTTEAVVICTSSFPEDISSIGSGEECRYERYDFSFYKWAVNDFRDDALASLLAYSDYGVSKFTDTDIDFRKLRYGILPKAKYTTESQYVVLKGKKNHHTGEMTKSFNDIARIIVSSDYYSGKDFSFGDNEIHNKAMPNAKPGNAANWVTYCANHHIVLLLEQISSLFSP